MISFLFRHICHFKLQFEGKVGGLTVNVSKAASTVQTKLHLGKVLSTFNVMIIFTFLETTPEKRSMPNFIDYLGEMYQFSG